MKEVLFCLKTFILTVAIVLVMQVQVGERTLEHHAMSWICRAMVELDFIVSADRNGAPRSASLRTDWQHPQQVCTDRSLRTQIRVWARLPTTT